MELPASPTLRRVTKGELCAGCGACAGIAPDAVRMTTIAPGYARPEQSAPLNSAQERAIATSCPGSTVAPWPDAPHRSPYWGPYVECLTGAATDPDIRHAGSSGAAISILAIHALRSGLVDQVLHVVADPDLPTRNCMTISTTAEAVIAGAGSRYAASSPLATIDALLASERKMAFIGKPCDVSALRQLARVDDRVDRLVPIMLSFFCGGLPSHAGADRIVRAMGLDPAELTSFRYRGNGWPGLTRAETRDGATSEMRYADSWGGHLSKEVQFRCKICPDAVGGVADIACADAWYGGESGYPQFDERDGRSLIMARTQRGAALLDAARSAGVITTEPLPVGEVDLMQPAQARRKRLVSARMLASRLLLQPVPRMAGLDVGSAARNAGYKEKAKNLLGTMRRIVQNRR